MAASDLEMDAQHPSPPSASRVNGPAATEEPSAAPLEPCDPREIDLHPSSQITLPSTEVPASPIDPASSFKTEVNDDRPAVTVIPSSLTPPPSTQVAPPIDDADADADADAAGRAFPSSQRSVLFSPPATILNTMRDREPASDYVPPGTRQIMDASADELRALLQTCIAEHQKLKMEAAHHKLQFNLLTLQADEESKRAAVEHDMVRRQVDALRMAEHSRQARRELSGTSESVQSKYLQMKAWYESAMEENENLHRRLKVAKKVIQQKEEETIGLVEEREMLLNRIRENREHFHMLCSPGGIFHGALTPKQVNNLSPPQQQQQQSQQQNQQQNQQQQQQHQSQHRATSRANPRTLRRDESDTREHGLSALLEAMNQSQDHATNNSAPTTPMVMARPAPRLIGRHHRNAQSMSSLPTTPMVRPGRDSKNGLLPSVNLVAQTEPRLRYSQRRYGAPSTPPLRRASPRKSRESTISADDNEQLARQAVESAKAAQSILAADAMRQLASLRPARPSLDDRSQQQDRRRAEERWATQTASRHELPRRRANDRGEMAAAGAGGDRDGASAAVLAKLFADGSARGEKRKLSGESAAGEPAQPRGSPHKKGRLGALASENPRVGLGIQYRR